MGVSAGGCGELLEVEIRCAEICLVELVRIEVRDSNRRRTGGIGFSQRRSVEIDRGGDAIDARIPETYRQRIGEAAVNQGFQQSGLGL